MIYVGIDVGITGAIVAILPDGQLEFHDMPTIKIRQKQTLDFAGVSHILRRYPSRGECSILVEQVASRPLQGVASSFNFGVSLGAILGSIAALQIPYQMITPQSWKKYHRLIGCDKDASRSRALELFPTAIEFINLKKHDGRAEGLLLAEYLRRSVSVK